jgi:hypothetical protein
MVLGPIMNNIENLVNSLTPDKIQSLTDSQKKNDLSKLTQASNILNGDYKNKEINDKITDDIVELKTSLRSNPTDNFNEMIEQARERNACDAECQFRKRSAELKIACDEAKKYESVDEERAISECKKYYVYAHGQQAWNELQDNKINERVDKLIINFSNQINEEKKNITNNIDSYNGLYKNFKNVLSLYLILLKENKYLNFEIKNEGSDILTNTRKTIYEEEGINNLLYIYYFLMFVYIVITIVFLISIFTFPSDMSIVKKIIIFIVILILPLIAPTLLAGKLSIINKLLNIVPKNVNLYN